MPLLQKPALSLKQFILRQEVKNLYRKIFKAIRQVPDESSRNELREWARREFRANSQHTEEITIKMYIKYGERCLNELQNNLNLAK